MKRDTNLLMAILADKPLDGWDIDIVRRHCELLVEAGYLKPSSPGFEHTPAGRDMAWLLPMVFDIIRSNLPEALLAAMPFSVLESLCRRTIEQRLMEYQYLQFAPTLADAGTTEGLDA